MSTPVAHVLAGSAVFFAIAPEVNLYKRWRSWLWFAFLALLPDFDFTPVILIGFDRANDLHHGYTHTFFFALLAATIIAPLWRWRTGGQLWRRWGMVFLLVSTHLLVDYLTRDNRPPIGTCLFWPLSGQYFISPIPIFLGVAKQNLRSVLSLYNLASALVDMAIGVIPVIIVLLTRKIPLRSIFRRTLRE